MELHTEENLKLHNTEKNRAKVTVDGNFVSKVSFGTPTYLQNAGGDSGPPKEYVGKFCNVQKDEYVKVEKNTEFVSHITFKTPPYLDPEQRVSSDDDDDYVDQPIKVEDSADNLANLKVNWGKASLGAWHMKKPPAIPDDSSSFDEDKAKGKQIVFTEKKSPLATTEAEKSGSSTQSYSYSEEDDGKIIWGGKKGKNSSSLTESDDDDEVMDTLDRVVHHAGSQVLLSKPKQVFGVKKRIASHGINDYQSELDKVGTIKWGQQGTESKCVRPKERSFARVKKDDKMVSSISFKTPAYLLDRPQHSRTIIPFSHAKVKYDETMVWSISFDTPPYLQKDAGHEHVY